MTAKQQLPTDGITVPGWHGKLDAAPSPEPVSANVLNTRLSLDESGYRLTTGRAGIFWNPVSAVVGDFNVRATFHEAAQSPEHPHPVGVFIAGSELNTEQPKLLYCVAYRDGTFLVRQFADGAVTTLKPKSPHVAVARAEDARATITQEVGWNVRDGTVECVVSGAVVWTATRGEITGPGKLESLDGIVGIRAGANVDVRVTGFGIE
jgi:hypothetical protein